MKEIINKINAIVEEATFMKNAYFWNPPCNATGRRSYEKQHSHSVVEWNEGGHHYTAEYTVSCSCKNIYAYGTYTRDGKKTTLTAVKNSLNRMEEMLKAI